MMCRLDLELGFTNSLGPGKYERMSTKLTRREVNTVQTAGDAWQHFTLLSNIWQTHITVLARFTRFSRFLYLPTEPLLPKQAWKMFKHFYFLALYHCSINIYATFKYFFSFFWSELLKMQPLMCALYWWRGEKRWLMTQQTFYATRAGLVHHTPNTRTAPVQWF